MLHKEQFILNLCLECSKLNNNFSITQKPDELNPFSIKMEKGKLTCAQSWFMVYMRYIIYYIRHENLYADETEKQINLMGYSKNCHKSKIMAIQRSCSCTNWRSHINRKEFDTDNGSRIVKVWDQTFFTSHTLWIRLGFFCQIMWIHKTLDIEYLKPHINESTTFKQD